MTQDRVIILGSWLPAGSPIYASWTPLLDRPCTFVSDYDQTWNPPADTGLIVTAQHYEMPDITLLRRAVESNIPTLVIADGILEYRNTWQNPSLTPGSLFQPVLTHKMACIGRSQARIISSWGNPGKCEVVGAPRLDSLATRGATPHPDGQPFRILVSTARTPGFTPQQLAVVQRSLQELKAWFDAQAGHIGARPIEVQWRLTGGMAEAIGVESEVKETLGMEFHAMLDRADALITTPSTTLLEGMLCDIPVVMLDYTNSPHYVPAAWTLSARDHFDTIIPELIDPPEARRLFQRQTLYDALECQSAAAPRMVRLIERMVQHAAPAREHGTPLAFPGRLLDDEDYVSTTIPAPSPLHELYPALPVLLDTQAQEMRVELELLRRNGQAQAHEIDTLKTQLMTSHTPRRRLGWFNWTRRAGAVLPPEGQS